MTAHDLYALTQESPTACYLLTELCELTGVPLEAVKAPERQANSLPDPLTQGQMQ